MKKLFLSLFLASGLAFASNISFMNAVSFTGPLLGDVTGTQGATVVSIIGGQAIGSCVKGTLLYFSATGVAGCLTNGTGQLTNDGAGNLSWAATSTGLTVGTTAIASGTNTRVLYDNSGVLGEYTITGTGNVVMSASPTHTGTVTAATITTSGQLSNSLAGAASTPSVTVTGAPYAAGSATTNKPLVLIENAATSTGWSTTGTYLGVNTASAFTGNQLDLQRNGVSTHSVSDTDGATPVTILGNTSTSTLTFPQYKATAAGRILERRNLGVTNYWDFDVNASTGYMTMTYGGDIAMRCTLQASPNCQFRGTTTNDDPTAGYMGEYTLTSRLASAATSVTTATALNVTASALSLTKGDWDVTGTVCYVAAATTSVTQLIAALSKTSATLPAADTTGVPTAGEYINQQDTAANIITGTRCVDMPPVRVSLTATTSIYLVGKAAFSVSTMTVYGSATARRIR